MQHIAEGHPRDESAAFSREPVERVRPFRQLEELGKKAQPLVVLRGRGELVGIACRPQDL